MVGGSSQKILQKMERGLALTLEEESRIREYVNKSDPSQIKPFIDRMADAMGIAPFTVVKGNRGGQDRINNLTPQQMKSLVLRGLIRPALEDDLTYRPELTGDYLGVPSSSKFYSTFRVPVPPPGYTDPMDNLRDVRALDPTAQRVEPEYGIPELGLKVPYQKMLREGYEESEVDHKKLNDYETALEKINDDLKDKAIEQIQEAAKQFSLQSIPYSYRVMDLNTSYKRRLAQNEAEANLSAEMFLDVILGGNSKGFVPTGKENLTGRTFAGTKISSVEEFSPQGKREIVVNRQSRTPEQGDAREVLVDYLYGRLAPGINASGYLYQDFASLPLGSRDIIREVQIEALQEESIAANQNEQLLANIEINPSATEAVNVILNPLDAGGTMEEKLAIAEDVLKSKWSQVTQQTISQFEPILNYLLSEVPVKSSDETKSKSKRKTKSKSKRKTKSKSSGKTKSDFEKNPQLEKYKPLIRLYSTIQGTTGFELPAELTQQAILEHGGFEDYYKYENINGRNFFVDIDPRLLRQIDYRNFVADYVSDDGGASRTENQRNSLRKSKWGPTLTGLANKLTKKIFAVTGYTKDKQILPGERYKEVTYRDEKGKKKTRNEKFVKGATNPGIVYEYDILQDSLRYTAGDPIYGEEFKEALKQHLSTVTLPGESGPRQALPSQYAAKIRAELGRTRPLELDWVGDSEDYIRNFRLQQRLASKAKDVSFYGPQDGSGFEEANYEAMQAGGMQSDDLKKEATARDRITKAIAKHNKTADLSAKLDPSIANQIYVVKVGRRFDIVQVDDVIGTNRLGTYSRVLKNLNEVIQRLLSIETVVKPRSRQTADLFPTEANVTYSEYGVPRIDIAGMSLGLPVGGSSFGVAYGGEQPKTFVKENVIRDARRQDLGAYDYGYDLDTGPAPIFAQLENPYQQNIGLGIPTQPGAEQRVRMTQGDVSFQTPEDYIRHIRAHEAAHLAFPPARVSPQERAEGIVGGRSDMEQAIEQATYGAVNPSAYDPMTSVEAREGQTGLPESRLDAPPIYVDPYRPSYLPEQAYTQPLATPQAFTTGVSDITAGGQGLPINQSTFAVNPSINLQAFDLDNLPPVDLSNVQQDNVFTYGGLDPTTDQTVQQDFVPGTTFRATARSPISRMPEQVREFSQPIDSGFIADVSPQTESVSYAQMPESFIRQNVAGQTVQPYGLSVPTQTPFSGAVAPPYGGVVPYTTSMIPYSPQADAMGQSDPVIRLEDFDGAQDTVDTSNQSLIDRMKGGAKSAVGAVVGAGKKTVGATKKTPRNVIDQINKVRATRGYKALSRIERIVMADELAELANAAWMEGEYRKGGDVLVGGKYVNNPVKEVVIGKDVNNFDELLTYLASANDDGLTEDGKTTGVAYLTEDEIRSLDSKRRKIVRDVQSGYYESAQSHPLTKELYKDIASYTADPDKPFGRTINILEPVDADDLASEDWSATVWDKVSAGLGEYNIKSVSEPENLFPRENLIYVPLLSDAQGRATSWSEIAQMGDAVAGFALMHKLPSGLKSKVLRRIPQYSLMGIAGADTAKSYSDVVARTDWLGGSSIYDNLGSGYLSRDESFTVRLREDVDASKFDKKKADEKLWDQIADSVPYTNLEFWSYDKEADTLTNRVSGTKVKPKDIGIPNYGDKLEAFVKYRAEMEQLSLDYSRNPITMRQREDEIRSNYEGSGSANRKYKSPPLKMFDYSGNAKIMEEREDQIENDYESSGLAWTDEDLGYTYAQKRKEEAAKEARMTATTAGFDAETYTGSILSDQGRIDRSVFEPKIDTITVHFDDDEFGNVELYDRRSAEAGSSFFVPSESSTTAGREPGIFEYGPGKFGRAALETIYNLRQAIPYVKPYERDRKYYRVIGED
jgi:hypothetical protein